MLSRLLIFGFLVVLAVVALHAAPLDSFSFYADDDVFDIAHVLGFATLSLIAAVRIRHFLPTRLSSSIWPWLIAAAISVAVAVVSEGVQVVTSRDADIGDFFRDLSGIAGGLLVGSALGLQLRFKAPLIVLGLIAVIGGVAQPARALTAKLVALRRLPILVDFEDDLQRLVVEGAGVRWDVIAAPPGFGTDGRVGRVQLGGPFSYPGIRLNEPPPDWSGYEFISFRVSTIEADRARLRIRIEDAVHNGEVEDRFSHQAQISTEPQTVRISLDDVRRSPANRMMDLSNMGRILFYMSQEDFVGFYIDDLRLE